MNEQLEIRNVYKKDDGKIYAVIYDPEEDMEFEGSVSFIDDKPVVEIAPAPGLFNRLIYKLDRAEFDIVYAACAEARDNIPEPPF